VELGNQLLKADEPAAVADADREQEVKYLNNAGRAVFNTLTGSQGVEQMTAI
jgi:chitinase